MMRWATLGSAVAFSAPAAAQVETREAQQRDLALFDREKSPSGLDWRAFAQLTGGRIDEAAEGDVGVGAELVVKGPNCDRVRVGGHMRAGWSSGARASAEQWASACISLIGESVMELGHHLEWGVRPTLLAPLRLRRGENHRETFSFHWQPLRVHASELAFDTSLDGELIVFEVQSDMTWLWSDDGPLVDQQAAEAYPFRYLRVADAPWGERRDVIVDVGTGGGEFTSNGDTLYFWATRLHNHRVGPLLLSGGIGLSSGSAGEYVMDYDREVDVTTPLAELGLETGTRHVNGYVRATNQVALAPDGFVTIDRRLAGGGGLHVGRNRVRLDASLASTKLYVPGTPRVRGTTGGASLSLLRGISDHLEATVLVEAARSFYAQPVDAMTPLGDPRWGVRAFAALQAAVGR